MAYYDACFTIKLYVRGSTPLPPLAPLTFCGQQHTISECAAVRPDSASSLNPTPPCLGGLDRRAVPRRAVPGRAVPRRAVPLNGVPSRPSPAMPLNGVLHASPGYSDCVRGGRRVDRERKWFLTSEKLDVTWRPRNLLHFLVPARAEYCRGHDQKRLDPPKNTNDESVQSWTYRYKLRDYLHHGV